MSRGAEDEDDDQWAGDSSATSSATHACDLCPAITAVALVSDDGFAPVVKVEDFKNTASKCQLYRIIYTNYAASATK